MSKIKKKKSITLILRNYFITGVVVLIPIGFTLYLSKILINLSSKLIPENINPNSYLPYSIPGIEIIISVIFITHNPAHAYAVADTFTVLNLGKSMGTFKKEEKSKSDIIELMSGGEELENLED